MSAMSECSWYIWYNNNNTCICSDVDSHNAAGAESCKKLNLNGGELWVCGLFKLHIPSMLVNGSIFVYLFILLYLLVCDKTKNISYSNRTTLCYNANIGIVLYLDRNLFSLHTCTSSLLCIIVMFDVCLLLCVCVCVTLILPSVRLSVKAIYRAFCLWV